MGLQAKINLEVGTCYGFALCCHRAMQPKLYSSLGHKKIEMCVCKLLCGFFFFHCYLMHGFPGDVNRVSQQNKDRWQGNNPEGFFFFFLLFRVFCNATIIDTQLYSSYAEILPLVFCSPENQLASFALRKARCFYQWVTKHFDTPSCFSEFQGNENKLGTQSAGKKPRYQNIWCGN